MQSHTKSCKIIMEFDKMALIVSMKKSFLNDIGCAHKKTPNYGGAVRRFFVFLGGSRFFTESCYVHFWVTVL